MHDLKACYRHSLAAPIGALECARRRLREHAADAGGTVRRLARSLRGSAGTYGFPEICAAAERVEEAPEDAIDIEVENLLGVLRPIATTDGGQVGILIVEDDVEM